MPKKQSNIQSHSSISSQRGSRQPLISQADQYPTLFKMKTAALIIITLALILLIIDLFMLVYLANNQPPPQNITFANDIIINSNLTSDSKQIAFLIQNMLLADQNTKFSHALIMDGARGSPSLEKLKEVFWEESDDMLFLMNVKVDDEPQNQLIGYFMHGAFPLPDVENIKNNITYYTFEIQDQRKSLIFNLNRVGYLNLNNTMSNPLNCKTYILDMNTEKLSLLNTIEIDLKDNTDSNAQLVDPVYNCFDDIKNKEEYTLKMNQILNHEINNQTKIEIEEYEIYHLS